nr:integrase, catalytic region, zinc finger, CCHC-type, peptidase aspartic, catalytic [Tanacetum cinerariifolium]
MRDRTDFASWQQHIRLYCQGKENGVNILKSIDEGPFRMGTVWEPLAEGMKGAPHLGPERPRVYSDLSPEEKDRYNAEIRAINILLQGLPKDIYTLINHYTDAKELWDNVKMLLEGSELTKEDRESQLVVVQNIQGRQNRGQGTNLRGGGAAGYGGVQNRIGNANPGQARQAPTAQTMFMANLSSVDLVTDEGGPSYDSDILSEVQDHDHYQDAVCAHHEEHAMHDNVQLNHIVDSHADCTSNSKMIPYDQTMDMTIDQQVALDEALVPHASRLRIGKSNFHLRSDIYFKESTLQLVYDVLRLTPFYKAFLVTADVLEIYMQEFWATATTFDDLSFEEEILAFLRFLGHNGEIRKLTDKKNVDFAYLLWEDFIYQVEHKDAKNSNEMYYPRNSEAYKEYYAVASGAAPPKTKASVQKMKSCSDTTITPPTAADIRLSTFAIGKQPTKPPNAKSLTVLSEDDDNQDDDDQDEGDDDDDQDEGNDDDQDSDEEGEEFIHPKLSIHDEEETKDEESFDTIAKTPENSDDEGNDDENLGLNVGRDEGQDAEGDEDELYRDVNINLEGRVVQMADVHTTQEFEDTHVTLTSVNPDCQQQSSSVSSQFVTSLLNPTPDAGIDSIFETTSQMDVQALTTVASHTLSAPTLTPSTIVTISTVPQAPTPPTTAPSTLLHDLLNFGSLFGFDHRLKTLEANFSEFMQTDVC